MKPYADSNFFTRIYFSLVESPAATNLLAQARRDKAPALPITWLHQLEVVNAFEFQVYAARQKNQSRVGAQHAAFAQTSFREDLRQSDFLITTLLPQEAVRSAFEDLSLRHTARHGFRTYDIIHVASALLLGCDTFWSFDAKASRLAKLEGLRTI
jgi:predicted nucleic acid-binding protein